MKIAAIVILYNPNEIVIGNIQSYINSVERLYIIDNTEVPVTQITERLCELPNSVYLHDHENLGIATRLNQASSMARNDGYDWLLTMDQDSSFKEDTLINYLKCVNTFKEKGTISMFGISYFEEKTGNQFCNSIKVNHLITSGSLLNLQLVPVIGGFDENLFIDEVDFEYCLRSVLKRFGIFRFTNIFLTHNLGETSYHRSFKNSKLTSRVLHSPERIYYMTRNLLYVRSKYRKTFTSEIKLRKKILLNRFKNNILYNKKRFLVIKYIAKAYWDYKKNRMGKLE